MYKVESLNTYLSYVLYYKYQVVNVSLVALF
jgi:hypothetical protein